MVGTASVETTPEDCVSLGGHDDGVAETPFEPKEVRRRIKQGRIQIKRTTGNRLIGHAQSVLMTFGVMMSCIAGHLLEPASQISQGVLECSQAFRVSGAERPSILELCSGDAVTTQEFKDEGRNVMRPRIWLLAMI